MLQNGSLYIYIILFLCYNNKVTNKLIVPTERRLRMNNITRSQWIDAKVEEFINSSNPCFTIDLYNSEIKRFEKRHDKLKIKKGPAVHGTSGGTRFSCVVSKKS